MEAGSNCVSPPSDNPLKKDECEANLKMFETLAALQVGVFIVSNCFWFTVVIPIVLVTQMILKINSIYNLCVEVVFIIDFQEILGLIDQFQ